MPYRPHAPARPIDWWVKRVPALVGLQVLIATLLRLRPGWPGLWLWYLGPSLLVILAGGLLVARVRFTLRACRLAP